MTMADVLYLSKSFFFSHGVLGALALATPLLNASREEEVTKHLVRRRIVELLDLHHCLSIQAMIKKLELAEGTVRHHLYVLERGGIVSSKASGRYLFWFLSRKRKGCPMDELILLQCSMNRTIVNTIIGNPGISQMDLAAQIGLSQSRTHYRMKPLLAMALVKALKSGKTVTYHPARKGLDMLEWFEDIRNVSTSENKGD